MARKRANILKRRKGKIKEEDASLVIDAEKFEEDPSLDENASVVTKKGALNKCPEGNRTIGISGGLTIYVSRSMGYDDVEQYQQSSIELTFMDFYNEMETVSFTLVPDRVRLLLKLLNVSESCFMKSVYGKEQKSKRTS
jgi:hypothetical protein